MAEMDDELAKVDKVQDDVKSVVTATQDQLDECSIYIGQVDYEATAEELRAQINEDLTDLERLRAEHDSLNAVELEQRGLIDRLSNNAWTVINVANNVITSTTVVRT